MSTSPGAFAEFRRGLTSASPGALAGAGILAVLMLLAMELALARGLLWRIPVQWLLSTPLDDWTHASWIVGRLRAYRGDDELVIVLGGSAAREAMHGNDVMSELFTRQAGHPVRFLNLGTRNQTVAEALVMVEQLPAVKRGTVVFSVHPMFLRDGPDDWREALTGVRFPFPSAALEGALRAVAPDIPPPFDLNVLRFRPQVANWLTRRLRQRGLLEPIRYVDHLYEGRSPQSDAALVNTLKVVHRFLAKYPVHRDHNLSLLEKAIAMARGKGFHVLLLDLPRNPVGDRTVLAPYLADYARAIPALAERAGAAYLDMHAELGFERQDFYDHAHFLGPARERFVPAFVAHMERLRRGEDT